MSTERERRYWAVCARISVLENALSVILKRLGAPDEDLLEWRRSANNEDSTAIHTSMTVILNKLRPPPGR